MYIKTPAQGVGNIQIAPAADGNESTIGYYTRSDLRATTAGDTWICGANGYSKNAYSIGTPELNNCLTINNTGNVVIPYGILTTEVKLYAIKVIATNGTVWIRNTLDASIAEFYDDKSSFLMVM